MQVELPPLLEFTEEQTKLLTQLHQDLTNRLADWQFNEPDQKELQMLQHAALSGRREQLKQLLSHDKEVHAAAEALAEEQKANQFNQTQEQ